MISEPRWDTATSAERSHAAEVEGAADPFDSLLKHVAEVREYALLYLETRKDQIRSSLRKALLLVILGLMALLVMVSTVVVSVVLLLLGVARGIGALLGDSPWAGELITGGLLLGAAAIAIGLALRRDNKSFQRRMSEKYGRRQRELQRRFGQHSAPEVPAGDTHE